VQPGLAPVGAAAALRQAGEQLESLNPIYNAQLHGRTGRRASARAAREAAQRHGRELARQAEFLRPQGCMLYWAERAKTRNSVLFTSSDADMLELFLRFLASAMASPTTASRSASTASRRIHAPRTTSSCGGCGAFAPVRSRIDDHRA
jgi:hypothetical protein